MASTFLMGQGSSLSISLDNTTFVRIGQLQQVSYSGGKLDFDDVSNLDSPSNFKEYAPTQNDAGQAQLSGVFSDSDAGQLMLSAANIASGGDGHGNPLYVKMQMAPHGAQKVGFLRTYRAYAAEPLNVSYSTTKSVSFSTSLKVTGPFTDTPGA